MASPTLIKNTGKMKIYFHHVCTSKNTANGQMFTIMKVQIHKTLLRVMESHTHSKSGIYRHLLYHFIDIKSSVMVHTKLSDQYYTV